MYYLYIRFDINSWRQIKFHTFSFIQRSSLILFQNIVFTKLCDFIQVLSQRIEQKIKEV